MMVGREFKLVNSSTAWSQRVSETSFLERSNCSSSFHGVDASDEQVCAESRS